MNHVNYRRNCHTINYIITKLLIVERLVGFKALNKALDGATSCQHRHQQARKAHCVQPQPPRRKPADFRLRLVHLEGKVHCQGTECRGPEQAPDIVEERDDDVGERNHKLRLNQGSNS